MTGVRSLDHPSGRSRLVCEQCDDLAQWIDPVFWQWFHYQGSFEPEDSGAPNLDDLGGYRVVGARS